MKELYSLKLAFGAVAVAACLNVSAVDYKEVTTVVSPEEIPANCEEIRMSFFIDGEQVYYAQQGGGLYYIGEPLEVLDSNGLKYTDMYIWNQTDWVTTYDYGLCKFKNPQAPSSATPDEDDYFINLKEGVYEIPFPADSFVARDEEGEIVTSNVPFSVKLIIGEPVIGPEIPTGFIPTSTYPPAGETVDSSFTDWTIVTYFDQEPIVNEEVMPYILIGDDKFMADEAIPMAKEKQIVYNINGMNERPNGEYTFVLPAGAVSYEDGQTNQTWTCKFKWEGGKNISTGDEEDAKIISATIGDVNIMAENPVLPNIQPEGCYLKLEVEPESIIGVVVSILDVTDAASEAEYRSCEGIWVNTMENKTGNTFTKEIYSIAGIKLFNDRKYVLQAELCTALYPIQQKMATLYSSLFTGETAAFQYSPVELVSIEPEPGSEIVSQEPLVLTFSAPVTLEGGEAKCGFANGNAGWGNFTSITSNADKTVWTCKFAANGNGPLTVCPHIWGYDQQGLYLRPAKYNVEPNEETLVFNGGEEDYTYIEIRYSNYSKCDKLVVAPTIVEVLEAVEFSIVGNKQMTPSYSAPFPEIKNESGDVVALVFADMYEEDGGHMTILESTGSGLNQVVRKVSAPLNNPISTEGTYYLEVPFNLFGVGTESNSSSSAPGIFTIQVSGQVAVEGIDADLETPVYYTIDGIRVDNPGKGLYIKVQGAKAEKVIL